MQILCFRQSSRQSSQAAYSSGYDSLMIGAFLAHMHAYRLHALAVVEFIEIPMFLIRLFLS